MSWTLSGDHPARAFAAVWSALGAVVFALALVGMLRAWLKRVGRGPLVAAPILTRRHEMPVLAQLPAALFTGGRASDAPCRAPPDCLSGGFAYRSGGFAYRSVSQTDLS